MNYDLIQVETEDKLLYHGLYTPGDKSKTACIFIHGFKGDFYSHDFFHALVSGLSAQSCASILCQHRGTGIHTEFLKRDGSAVNIGSYHEKLEDAHLDISAYVKFLLHEGYERIAIIGHSLGTIKTVRYLFEGAYKKQIEKIVLLAPFVKNILLEQKAPGNWQTLLDEAKAKVDAGKGADIVPVPEYEDYPMSYTTFYSWYAMTELNKIWDFHIRGYESTILKNITIPVKVVLGGKDAGVIFPEFEVTPDNALSSIQNQIPVCETVLIPQADHCFIGYGKEVSRAVCEFLG